MTEPPRYIRTFIKGVPYGGKGHGSAGAQDWTGCVKSATEQLGRVKDACIVNVTFHLHPMNYRSIKHGTDIDNLLNRLFDALKETIFVEAPGRDSCVISVHAVKREVELEADTGADLEILPVAVAGPIG